MVFFVSSFFFLRVLYLFICTNFSTVDFFFLRTAVAYAQHHSKKVYLFFFSFTSFFVRFSALGAHTHKQHQKIK